MLSYIRLRGEDARKFRIPLAELRLSVFNDFPYLYEGNREYEMKYLETYFRSESSFIFLIQDNDKVVGATTSIWAMDEEDSFRKPFEEAGFRAEEIFYFGESVLLPDYRNRGLGKLFFTEREAVARTLPKIRYTSFCAVQRPSDHPQRPVGYRPLDEFWKALGYEKAEGLETTYAWKDKGESRETKKRMQFWMKKIR